MPFPPQTPRPASLAFQSRLTLRTLLAATLLLAPLHAQTTPTGQVLFERSLPSPDETPATPPTPSTPDQTPAIPVTDTERTAILLTASDLDLHLLPAEARIEARATLTLRNQTAQPLTRIPLQLSSTLRWQSIQIPGAAHITFTQSPIATDTDHTGYAQEAVLTLPGPLGPGKALTLTALYSGEIRRSAARLELIGTPPAAGAQTDWDRISAAEEPAPIALRGFGNVLWYPVAQPIALLGDGNRLFDLVGQVKRQQAAATMRLRLTIDYRGEPPTTAILNGTAQPLTITPDDPDQTIAEAHGIATAAFPAAPIGFRIPSLVVLLQQPTPAAQNRIATVTFHSESAAPYAAAAALTQPFVAQWLGPAPANPLLLVDHTGQPFEDDSLLLIPFQPHATADSIAPILVHGLTHAALHSTHPWIDEGLPQFLNILWTEQTRGRPDALLELQHQANTLAFAEPDLTQSPPPQGQTLLDPTSEIYYRTKAAAVWWQLRDILGEETLQHGLQAYRRATAANPEFDRDPHALQTTLEKTSERRLDWFFDDWVNHDHGLPDLAIGNITTHPLPARDSKPTGYLVAVEVRNTGDAACEVPVTIRSGNLSASERLRIPPRASASTRIPFEGTPESIQVNDGSVPELRSAIHLRTLTTR